MVVAADVGSEEGLEDDGEGGRRHQARRRGPVGSAFAGRQAQSGGRMGPPPRRGNPSASLGGLGTAAQTAGPAAARAGNRAMAGGRGRRLVGECV